MIAGLLAGAIIVVLGAGRFSPIGSHRPVHPETPRRRRVDVGDSVTVVIARLRRKKSLDPLAIARWVDDLARHLRHGSTLRNALTTVVPDVPALAIATDPVRHALARGATLGAACDEWQTRIDAARTPWGELLRTVASVIAVSGTLGGSAAAPLDRVAAVMRQHASEDLERSAQSAQARISARVLTLLPFAVLALMGVSDAAVRAVITEPAGVAVVASGAILNVLGAAWMRQITRAGP